MADFCRFIARTDAVVACALGGRHGLAMTTLVAHSDPFLQPDRQPNRRDWPLTLMITTI
jgi:hypothetical protein